MSELTSCDCCDVKRPCVSFTPYDANGNASGSDVYACHVCRGHESCDECEQEAER